MQALHFGCTFSRLRVSVRHRSAVARVDAAPGNSRRIYMGVDINADVPTVWDLLTDYEGLADVVPNLVSNEVIKKTEEYCQ